MNYSGEALSLLVALMWTFTALFAEVASRRLGPLTLNVWRMLITIALLGVTLWLTCGSPWPQYVPASAWAWLLGSGFMGFVFGDYCLFTSYMIIGSRFGQLFMTLASPFAAITAWMLMGERMSLLALIGMIVTLFGIGMSIMGKDDGGHRRMKLPLHGVLLGIGAGMGQGVGLVFSKIGLQAYEEALPATAADVATMIPFAGTMIRVMMGLVGFGLALIWTGQTNTMPRMWHDRRGAAAALGAILLGPFLGVSLSLKAVGMTHAGVAQTLMSLTPVFILWPAHLIFGTKITWKEAIGAVIAVAGASLFFL
ncbi:MAG: DMT family transporter [Bacteroidaceae bacterium]|nr:DMT family transporter [Bacteroidaceae bacterium]